MDGLNDIEARFELATLSLNITKPQLVLLNDIHQSWTNGASYVQSSLSGSSLVLDVFHPSGLCKIFIRKIVRITIRVFYNKLCSLCVNYLKRYLKRVGPV